jgi:hypothetical protein
MRVPWRRGASSATVPGYAAADWPLMTYTRGTTPQPKDPAPDPARHRPPGHWAARSPGFTYGLADFAHGLDSLAEAAGHPDGLTLVVKEFGAAPGEVLDASQDQASAWFTEAYARWGTGPRFAGDVVHMGSLGINSFEAGWSR